MFTKLFGIGDLSPEKFTLLVARMGVESGRLVDPDVNAADMSIKSNNHMMHLGNAYKQFLALPRRERARYIAEAVLRPPPELPTTWDQVVPKLIANVRSGAKIGVGLAEVRAMGGNETNLLAHKEIGPDLYATLAIDTAHAMMPVTVANLTEWGKTFDEAFAIGVRKLAESALGVISTGDGFWIGSSTTNDDSYVAANILLPQMLQSICKDPYVVVPQRGKIFLGDPAVATSYDTLATFAHNPDDSYRISSRVYQLIGTKLVEATPPKSAAATALAQLIGDDLHAAYDRERELWDKEPYEGFLAKYKRLRFDNNEVVSMTMWMQSIEGPTHLPETDLVTVMIGDPVAPDIVMVPFNALVAKCGFVRTASPLPRWVAHPETFPSLAWLKAHEYQRPETN